MVKHFGKSDLKSGNIYELQGEPRVPHSIVKVRSCEIQDGYVLVGVSFKRDYIDLATTDLDGFELEVCCWASPRCLR